MNTPRATSGGSPGAAEVTVVIATRDRTESLARTLRMLRNLPDGPRIIVVDNGSQDGTAALAQSTPGVELIRLERNAGAAGRTAGVRAAATPYVAFADDDSWWAPGALEHAAQVFACAPRLGLLAARITVEPGGEDDPVCAAMAAGPPSAAVSGGRDVLGFVACGAVVRRSAYLAVGGFHPRFGVGGEEDLLAMDLWSASWSCVYVPEVVATHAPCAGRPRPGRKRREVRNALWTAWLRSQPAGALRRTGQALGDWRAPATWAGLAAAVAGLPWVLAERAPASARLDAWRGRLDAGRPR